MANSKGNILVASYSRDGSVEALAKAVAEGARSRSRSAAQSGARYRSSGRDGSCSMLGSQQKDAC